MAYVTLLYGGNKYLEGILLTGLGLRKQNIKYNLICMITEDCIEYKDIINIIYDEIIVIPYITPKEVSFNSIKISNKIFITDQYIDIFTKINIFNKKILNYNKIVFIDSDLIPIKNFDILFTLDTPAAWLELKKGDNIEWHEWSFNMNDLIPKKCMDQLSEYGCSINGGLMIITPDNDIYNNLINTLQSEEILNKHNKYKFPEQQFLTQEFLGQWHYISGLYNSWKTDFINVNGIHMAGLHRFENNKKKFYKSWEFQFNNDDAINIHTNLTYIYALNNYPKLKEHVLKSLNISIDNKLFKFTEIKDLNINLLSASQMILYNTYF
jgi:hypothetical protein